MGQNAWPPQPRQAIESASPAAGHADALDVQTAKSDKPTKRTIRLELSAENQSEDHTPSHAERSGPEKELSYTPRTNTGSQGCKPDPQAGIQFGPHG